MSDDAQLVDDNGDSLASHGMTLEEQAAYEAGLRQLIVAARTSFLAYVHLFNPQGAAEYILSDVHRALIQVVQDVADGAADPNTAISMPPQHGKSTLLSKEAPSWILGRQRGINVAITGHSSDLVTDFSKWIRERVNTQTYQQVFPESCTVRGSDRMDNWEMQNGSSVVVKPAGSKLIGRRVDWLVCDDVHPGRAEAESPTMRQKVVDWYFADCMTRLHPRAKTFLIGTRWHPQDLIGHLTSGEYVAQLDIEEEALRAESDDYVSRKFRVVKFSAIAEEGVDDGLGREPGEALFPEERPRSFLMGFKATIPNYDWDSVFQQNPRSASSGQADLSRLIYVEKTDVPWSELELVRGWDLAITDKQTSDYTCGLLLGVQRSTDALYILDVRRARQAWAKMRANVLTTSAADRSANPPVLRIGIEGVSGFDAIYQDVKQELLGEVKVEKKNPPKGGGKLLRAQTWLNRLEAGHVHVLRATWTKDFIDELENFPDGRHDDQVDAMSVAYELVETPAKRVLIA